MTTFQSQAASDALSTLDRFEKAAAAASEPSSTLADGVATVCQRAGIEEAEAGYLTKFARHFESYSTLSTEELVKRALSRFLKSRDTDALLAGIKLASGDERAVARAAWLLLDGQKAAAAEDAALAVELEKRAGFLRSLGPALARMGGRVAKSPVVRGGAQALNKLRGALGQTTQGLVRPALLGAGGYYGAQAAGKGMHGLYQSYGAPAGERRALESLLPMISSSRDPDAILSYIQQLQGAGGEISPEVWAALRHGLRYQANPWMRANPFA